MKFAVVILPFLAIATPVHAQIDLRLPSIPRPSVRIGPWTLSATLDGGGVGVRIDEDGSPRSRTGTPLPGPTPRPAPSPAPSATARSVLATADDYLGVPYVYGGETPSGFDCSGFVQYVFRRHGIGLPRTSRQQAQVGQSVARDRSQLRAGDLMLFASDGSRIDHIAIYAGSGRIIHSSSSGGGVGYDDLSSQRGRWFVQHHVATRRVIDGGHSLVAELSAALRAHSPLDGPDFAPPRR